MLTEVLYFTAVFVNIVFYNIIEGANQVVLLPTLKMVTALIIMMHSNRMDH